MKRKTKLTTEQEMALRVFYMKREEQRRKQIRDTLNAMWKGFKILGNFVLTLIHIFTSIFIASIFGIGVKPIILLFNYPLGEGYATFASYAVSGLVMYLLLGDSLRQRGEK